MKEIREELLKESTLCQCAFFVVNNKKICYNKKENIKQREKLKNEKNI